MEKGSITEDRRRNSPSGTRKWSEALYKELKAQKAFAANTAQPNLERARAKASAEDMNENGQAIQQAFKQAIPKLKEG